MPEPARRYSHITKAVYGRPWAIIPSTLAVIDEILQLRAAGSPLTDEEIETRIAAAQNGPRSGAARAQGVAVIPVYGVISPRMDLMTAMSGGTSVEGLTRAFREAQADPDVGAIVLDVDSPGGMVDGIPELAAEIRAARGGKPIAAVADHMMASAAYWLGSAADEVIASPSAAVGSIGVIGHHVDYSKADEMAGETWTVISAGEGKEANSGHVPLTDDARAELQAMADDFYAAFSGDVAAARRVPVETVTDDWKAGVFTAKRAKSKGLVDRIDTLDATVRRMVVQANQTGQAAAHALAAAGLTAQEQISVLLSTLAPIDQRAVLDQHTARLGAEAEPLAQPEPKSLPDGPEEATAGVDERGRLVAARARAVLATAHVRIPSEEVSHA